MRNIVLDDKGQLVLDTTDRNKALDTLCDRFNAKTDDIREAIDLTMQETGTFAGMDVVGFNVIKNPAFFTLAEEGKPVAIVMFKTGIYVYGLKAYSVDEVEGVVRKFKDMSKYTQDKLIEDVKAALADDTNKAKTILALDDDENQMQVTATILGA